MQIDVHHRVVDFIISEQFQWLQNLCIHSKIQMAKGIP